MNFETTNTTKSNLKFKDFIILQKNAKLISEKLKINPKDYSNLKQFRSNFRKQFLENNNNVALIAKAPEKEISELFGLVLDNPETLHKKCKVSQE